MIVRIDLPDVGESEEFGIGDGEIEYRTDRDYFRSGFNILEREGFTFSSGFDCSVSGEIPVNAGTSSSSALVVAWIDLLARMSDEETVLGPERLAELACRAEVGEFAEPGGMMDQYTIALGRVITMASHPETSVRRLDVEPGPFVLGDSGEPKDTKSILSRVRGGIMEAVERILEKEPGFSLFDVGAEELRGFDGILDGRRRRLLAGTVGNRDITRRAIALLERRPLDRSGMGRLICEQQAILRDDLEVSTPKLDAMIEAALGAGALGAKINGSGGGGCMFAYAPDDPEAVLEAVGRFGRAWIVDVDEGRRAESMTGIDG